jgi:hypothetical protein
VYLSIGIIAWNEALAIPGLVESLSRQTVFKELCDRSLGCEIVVVPNGCTDKTAEAAEEALAKCFGLANECAKLGSPSWKVLPVAERGKLNAWNQFVHRISAREARFLLLLDADILFVQPETVWNMVSVLREEQKALVSVDTPMKRVAASTSAVGALSTSAGMITAAAPAQLCGQAYCIRAETARNIYLPKDLAACDDGFIKALVCTDCLTRPLTADRICLAPNAGHTFEAYTTPGAILRNQKRQVIGQTIVHILVDQYLPSLPYTDKLQLAATLREKDSSDPDWLKRRIALHVAEAKVPWRLYPQLLTHRFQHLRKLSFRRKILSLPGLLAGMAVSFVASWLAFRALKSGCTDYWPKARRKQASHPAAPLRHQKVNIN